MLDAMPNVSPNLFAAPVGLVRNLDARDLADFRDHLLRLTPASRRDRFNGYTDDGFVAAYAARSVKSGAVVIGYVENGILRGAAELHDIGRADREAAEVAFSVEDAFQHRGIGARLFERLIVRALELGYRSLHVTTHPQNRAMKALARNFGAVLCFQSCEAVGVIDMAAFQPKIPLAAEPISEMRLIPWMAEAGLAGTMAVVGRTALIPWAPATAAK